MVEETGDIAHQFCLSNANPHSEARKLLLSPSLTNAMKVAKMRHGIIDVEPVITVVTETPAPAFADGDIMPPHFDSSYNQAGDNLVIEEQVAAATPTAICKPGRVFTMNGIRYAEIHHAPANGGTGWTDRLALKQIDGRWMIDDILFAPDYRRTMRATLIKAE